MSEPIVVLRGDERTQLGRVLRQAYEAGRTVRDCMALSARSYGTTYRLLVEAGTQLRPRRQPR